jgi:F420-dependent oxidoreductase-like protein
VDIVRQVFARERPVTASGAFFSLPVPADVAGSTGLGKALKPTVHPLRADLPIVLAAQGPKNVALAAEIADGWMAGFYAPRTDAEHRALLAEGFAARSGARAASSSVAPDFEVLATVPVVVRDDVDTAADVLRPHVALSVGGMGAKGANFHKASLDRLGYGDVLDEVQAHFLAGRKEQAAAAVPLSLIEEIALVGPACKVRADLARWDATAVTTLLLQGDPASVLAALAAEQGRHGTTGGAFRSRAGAALARFAPRRV